MRIFRWAPEFSPLRESPWAPVWISFPGPPQHLFAQASLFLLVETFRNPLKLDQATVSHSRPSCARMLVEIDISHPLPPSVRINFSELGSFWQPIVYESYPTYCSICLHQGHSAPACKISRPHNSGLDKDSGLEQNNNQVEATEARIVKDIPNVLGKGVAELGGNSRGQEKLTQRNREETETVIMGATKDHEHGDNEEMEKLNMNVSSLPVIEANKKLEQRPSLKQVEQFAGKKGKRAIVASVRNNKKSIKAILPDEETEEAGDFLSINKWDTLVDLSEEEPMSQSSTESREFVKVYRRSTADYRPAPKPLRKQKGKLLSGILQEPPYLEPLMEIGHKKMSKEKKRGK